MPVAGVAVTRIIRRPVVTTRVRVGRRCARVVVARRRVVVVGGVGGGRRRGGRPPRLVPVVRGRVHLEHRPLEQHRLLDVRRHVVALQGGAEV